MKKYNKYFKKNNLIQNLFLKINEIELCKSCDSWKRKNKKQKGHFLTDHAFYILSLKTKVTKRELTWSLPCGLIGIDHWLRGIKIGERNFTAAECLSQRIWEIDMIRDKIHGIALILNNSNNNITWN